MYVLFHGISFYFLEKRKKTEVTVLIFFQEGQIYPTPTDFQDNLT